MSQCGPIVVRVAVADVGQGARMVQVDSDRGLVDHRLVVNLDLEVRRCSKRFFPKNC